MPLSPEDIAKPRSPVDLFNFVEQVIASVRADLAELHIGNARRGYYKEFLDEVVPLACFTLQLYDNSHTVEPILGNQGFDAVIRNESGHIVDKVEIANAIDGASVSAIAREVAHTGYGGLTVGNPGDDLEALIPIIERVAKDKAIKDYSGVTVVFNIAATTPFEGFQVRHNEQLDRIRKILVSAGFRAKRVFMILPSRVIEKVFG